MLLLLIHEGLRPAGDDAGNEIHAIARRFPEFDVILGGHLHELVIAPRGLNVLYLEAGCHGGAVGRVDFLFDTDQRRVVRRAASALLASHQVPEEAALRAYVQDDLLRAEKYLAEPVGSAATAVAADGMIKGQSPLQQLFCRAIAEKVHADVVSVLDRADFRQLLAKDGSEPVGSTPDEYAATIRREQVKWGKLIKTLGIRED